MKRGCALIKLINQLIRSNKLYIVYFLYDSELIRLKYFEIHLRNLLPLGFQDYLRRVVLDVNLCCILFLDYMSHIPILYIV